MPEDEAIAHLEAIRIDIRDEIKRRIEQRDKYSIQLTIALAALVAISLSTGFGKALLAAPLVSIYFTVLILYSYRVHSILARYLCEEIEPELSLRCETPSEKEWETWYQKQEVPGIRRSFFLRALWVVTSISLFYLWVAEFYLWIAEGEQIAFSQFSQFRTALFVATIVYFFAVRWITKYFGATEVISGKTG